MVNSKKLKPAKRIFLDFYPSEAALIEQVEKQPRKQTYIKDLIRRDMSSSSDPFAEALAAIEAYGIRGKVSLIPTSDRIYIEVDGGYFGIWDTVRKTFVD